MWIPTKGQLEMAGTIIGVTAPALSGVRASVIYARDRSLQRRKSEALRKVDKCVKRMSKLGGNSELLQFGSLSEGYTDQVREEVERSLKDLRFIREQEARREIRRREDPQ